MRVSKRTHERRNPNEPSGVEVRALRPQAPALAVRPVVAQSGTGTV
jgi:hypothetical protein